MARLFLGLFVTGCVLSFAMTFPQDRQHQLVQRNGGNPRSSRGFQLQNGKLSTARGFGKRGEAGFGAVAQSPSFGNFPSDATFPPSFDSRSSYSNNWLADEIQTNPESARYVIEKFVDENGDGEVTPEELFRRNFL